MAKRKKKSVADLVDEKFAEPVATEEVEAPPPQKEKPYVAVCGVCNKKGGIAYHDADGEWEPPGHPDHIDRPVCVTCAPDEVQRDKVCELVYDAMRTALNAKKLTHHDVEQAIHVAWRAFSVEHDDKELVSMARKLKVEHPWLKGRKSK